MVENIVNRRSLIDIELPEGDMGGVPHKVETFRWSSLRSSIYLDAFPVEISLSICLLVFFSSQKTLSSSISDTSQYVSNHAFASNET